VFAGEVDAEEQFAGVGAEDIWGAGFSGFGGFAGGDEIVGEEDAGSVEEFALVFLRPRFGIAQPALEQGDVYWQAVRDGFVDGDFVAGEDGGRRD